MKGDYFFRQHPILANILIICLVGIIGVIIAFLFLGIFTRHGDFSTVPDVENMSFTQAVKTLHSEGFRTDIRDSIYNEEIQPGYVIEQFPTPGSKVKPGRKVFLYINAVNPRQVLIDADNSSPGEAMKGYSMRQGLAKLEELGFKKINVIKIPGEDDRIIRLIANGKPVNKMQKVPINALITVEVHDGQLYKVTDSILEQEYIEYVYGEDEENFSVENPENSSEEPIVLYD